jgi:hypothetical protein
MFTYVQEKCFCLYDGTHLIIRHGFACGYSYFLHILACKAGKLNPLAYLFLESFKHMQGLGIQKNQIHMPIAKHSDRVDCMKPRSIHMLLCLASPGDGPVTH